MNAVKKMRANFGQPGAEPKALMEALKGRGFIVGGTDEVVERLGGLAELGLDEIMFQHLDFDSDDIPEYLASEIIPRVRGF